VCECSCRHISQSCVTVVDEQGKVEAELNLVTNEEKELNPVGIARKEPEALPPPKYVIGVTHAQETCARNLHRCT